MTWDLVFGVISYGLRYRLAGDSEWSHPWMPTDKPFYHHTDLASGSVWELSVRSEYGTPEQGGLYGDWSDVLTATSM